jgi:hypothetical protein
VTRARRAGWVAPLALAAACVRPADVCELEFRVRSDRPAGPVEVAAAVVTVHERLKPLAGRRGLETTSRGAEAIVVRLGFEPDEATLAAIRARVERRGALEFLPVVCHSGSLPPRGPALDELDRFLAWRHEHAGADVAEFNALAPEQGGPATGHAWFPFPVASDPHLLCDVGVRGDPERYFCEVDLGLVAPGTDQSGFPAVRFAMREARREAFGRFTEALVRRQLAIVLDGAVVTAPEVRSALSGESIIEGRFALEERDALLDVLRSAGVAGRLPFDLSFAARTRLE